MDQGREAFLHTVRKAASRTTTAMMSLMGGSSSSAHSNESPQVFFIKVQRSYKQSVLIDWRISGRRMR